MQTRNAASVLPVPVGAAISVSRPSAIAGQPCAWASVGPPGKRRSNQVRTAGWKEASASMAGANVARPPGENQAKSGGRVGFRASVVDDAVLPPPHAGDRRDRALRPPEGTAPPRARPPRAGDAARARRLRARQARDRRLRRGG